LTRVGERKGAYRFLLWKSEGRSTLGNPRRRWLDNTKGIFKIWDGWYGLD